MKRKAAADGKEQGFHASDFATPLGKTDDWKPQQLYPKRFGGRNSTQDEVH